MKTKLKQLLAKRPRRKKKAEPEKLDQAIQSIPRITNETVAEHREEVLSSARKYIYPLKHSAHKVVIISTSLFAIALVTFFTYCLLAVYKFHSTSTFIYRISQVIPFPVAKAGSHYISYESYLFELRHYMHYYETQQKVDFSSESGKQQLADFQKQALDSVVTEAYVKQLAKQNGVSVSDKDLNDAIALVRSQNRLGSSDQVFEDVLKEFWGWSVADFKRELKQEMLAQKVVATLDTDTQGRARQALDQLKGGADFASVAKQFSDDVVTKENGGSYGISIDKSDRDLPPQVIDVLFKLKPGETSDIVTTATGLEILQLKDVDGNKVHAAHIMFNFKPISTYTDPLHAKQKPHNFIKV
ncbi:MAG TPA: SurA N-terminal domain-containing protein [Ktedonobacteraceae bacterium]|nr:SurA N-terminal domain-containing protein [Ktedonobacteraceae bacterium]